MKVKYFEDTDTLFIQLSNREVSKTQDLNENVLLDFGRVAQVFKLGAMMIRRPPPMRDPIRQRRFNHRLPQVQRTWATRPEMF